jgi:hydrogenase expression/formation protein HypC
VNSPVSGGSAGPSRSAGPSAGAGGPSAVPECHGDVCITCSDFAVAVTITALLEDDMAIVDTGEGAEEVSIALVTAGVGDTILVHAREAIAVVGS